MTTEKLHFTKEKETMLMYFPGQALQSQWQKPIVCDPWVSFDKASV